MGYVTDLETLVYYAIDYASPYDLALHAGTDDLDKIKIYSLHELHITNDGLADMWQTINGYAHNFGGETVPAAEAIKCATVAHVWDAVVKASGQ